MGGGQKSKPYEIHQKADLLYLHAVRFTNLMLALSHPINCQELCVTVVQRGSPEGDDDDIQTSFVRMVEVEESTPAVSRWVNNDFDFPFYLLLPPEPPSSD